MFVTIENESSQVKFSLIFVLYGLSPSPERHQPTETTAYVGKEKRADPPSHAHTLKHLLF